MNTQHTFKVIRFSIARITLGAFAFLPVLEAQHDRADPSDWIVWRAAPFPFPDSISPQVPEYLDGPPVAHFGSWGENLTIILPDEIPTDYDGRALTRTKDLIRNKSSWTNAMTFDQAGESDLQKNLLIMGTMDNNPIIEELLGSDAENYFDDIRPGGYRMHNIPNPYNEDNTAIIALGRDMKGAWAMGLILAHSIHPNREGVNVLLNWPVTVPTETYLLPFEAVSSPPEEEYEVTGFPDPPPDIPDVPFGVRIWGSPVPDLNSYQRLIRALKEMGADIVAVQSGGWVDLPNAAEVFTKALDISWQEGVYTILYAGNEMYGHLPSPLTDNHRDVVLATKDHPGLYSYHLYNQITSEPNMTPEQYQDLEAQVRWMKENTDKTLGMEVVWGHNISKIPQDKIDLMEDLKEWGVDTIATDYAPVGGWASQPNMQRWEAKLIELRPIEDKPEVVIQGHVPFLDATVPSPEEVRNQYWWALVGGAKTFLFEAAYNYTHYTIRGLLSWDLRPHPDGRYDEIKRLSQVNQLMSPIITESEILSEDDPLYDILTLGEPSNSPVSLRIRETSDNKIYAILINEDVDKSQSVELKLSESSSESYTAKEVLTGKIRGQILPGTTSIVTVPTADAVVIELVEGIEEHSWSGWPIDENDYIQTNSFFGDLWVQNKPWAYSTLFNRYVYVEEDFLH